MPKDVHVLIVEDDPYALDLMAMLLTRDWRTRVVGETHQEDEIIALLNHPTQKVDILLLDTEIPGDPKWAFELAKKVRTTKSHPAILCTGTRTDEIILRQLQEAEFNGYIIKSEIHYALAWGVKLAAQGKWVITKGVRSVALNARVPLPANTIVVDGTMQMIDFSVRQWEIIRLAILFNQTRSEVAEELRIRPDSVSDTVSESYEKLGLHEILSGEVAAETYIEDVTVLRQFNQILARIPEKSRASGKIRKSSDMSTLAFHLLTIPEEKEII